MLRAHQLADVNVSVRHNLIFAKVLQRPKKLHKSSLWKPVSSWHEVLGDYTSKPQSRCAQSKDFPSDNYRYKLDPVSISNCFVMGVTPTKRSPAKNGRSPAKERRSRSKTLKATVSPAKDVVHSHVLPDPEQIKANGRVSGRDLIAWTRGCCTAIYVTVLLSDRLIGPRMMEKLMLHMHYECARHKLNMPWNAIAHRLHPGSSGAALLQHLNRVRRELLIEGHLVPPLAQKPSLAAQNREPNLRGYIRKFPHGSDTATTRPVYFDEKIEDLKQSLPYGEEATDGEADNEYEMEEEKAARQSSPFTPSPSQPVPVMTPTRTGRSAISQIEGVRHEARGYHAPGHQATSSFDSVSQVFFSKVLS